MSRKRKSGRRSPDFGLELPVTPTWRIAVEKELQRREWANVDLANAIPQGGASTGAISQVLRGGYKSSSLVRPISEVLGLELPMPSAPDEEMAQWLITGTALRASNRALFCVCASVTADEDLAAWIQAGAQLRESNSRLFATLLAAARAGLPPK